MTAADRGDPTALCALAAAAAREAGLPSWLREHLVSAYGGYWTRTVAVRSYVLGEDRGGVSLTNVRGIDELFNAVLGCWESVFRPRSVIRRARRGPGAEPAVAVVVQQMVPAQRSGVASTGDPITGEHAVVVVEAMFGQGEVLVSCAVRPDTYRFTAPRVVLRSLHVGHQTHEVVRGRDGHDTTLELGPERADTRVLDDAEAASVARLALRVQQHFGAPQEIEWVMVARTLWLVRARPVTGLRPSRSASAGGRAAE